MGISSKQGKPETVKWVNDNKDSINNILDIGAGSGTYYKLLSPIKTFKWSAVEAWKSYIEEFNLEQMYEVVYNEDIRNFKWQEQYDLVIAGDILEHMTKSEAEEVVKKILDHTKTLIISIPITHMPQEAINDNPFEYHVKDDWSHKEILDTWSDSIKEYWIPTGKKVQVGVYWLSKK
jgi:cyclopropane fatty-acyl-phospholipid synthase-like methyltransferase